MELAINEISFNSEEYQALLHFRNQWLRQPLGLNLMDEDLSMDKQDKILVVQQYDEIVGCIMIHPVDEHQVKFRQMAIHPRLQGKGIGKVLLEDAEQSAKEMGAKKIVLHARSTAIPFYEKSGYQPFGEPFVEVTIPHLAMQKDI